MRKGMLKYVALLVTFVVLGIFVGSETASGVVVTIGTCPKAAAQCSGLPNNSNSSCPAEEFGYSNCTWQNAAGTYLACGGGGTCAVITPVVPQTCNGACVLDMNLGCSMTFNKCK